jgi:hypothetical protein
MKRVLISILFAFIVVALLVTPVLAAGNNGQAGKSKIGHLYLYEKDPLTWKIVEDGAWGKMVYNLSGTGNDTAISAVFNGQGLIVDTSYSLIYYPEVAPVSWPSEGWGVVVLGSGTANDDGDVLITGTGIIGPPDTQPPVGDYIGKTGDKIWLVLSSDLSSGSFMTGWTPTEYLFESALINTNTFLEPPGRGAGGPLVPPGKRVGGPK